MGIDTRLYGSKLASKAWSALATFVRPLLHCRAKLRSAPIASGVLTPAGGEKSKSAQRYAALQLKCFAGVSPYLCS